jgi:hypothetical protein
MVVEPSRLSDDDVEPTDRRTNDLKMLITPMPRPLEKEQAKLIGRRFQSLRQRRDLWIPEVAHLLGRDTSVVRDIDYVSRFRQANLGDYMQYADVLGYSLCEIFDEQSLEELVKQVEHTLNQLEARGEPIVLQHVCDLVGLTYSSMVSKYPRMKALFHEYQKNRSEHCLSPRVKALLAQYTAKWQREVS